MNFDVPLCNNVAVCCLAACTFPLHIQHMQTRQGLQCVSFSVYSQQNAHDVYPSLLHEPSSKPEGAGIGYVQQAFVKGIHAAVQQDLFDGFAVQTIKQREATK